MAIRPERKLNSAIDLESWMAELSSFDQLLLEKRMEGHTLNATAADMGVSPSVVHYRTRKLGLELAARAGVRIERGRRRAA
jgi:hypothetical protein